MGCGLSLEMPSHSPRWGDAPTSDMVVRVRSKSEERDVKAIASMLKDCPETHYKCKLDFTMV